MPFPPGASPSPIAQKIWNLCGGIEWSALPLLAEVYGVSEMDILIHELAAIRDFKEACND